MHNHNINAALQLVPIVQDRHPYKWVDEVIDIIAGSGLHYQVGPFNTTIEAEYSQVMDLINRINEFLIEKRCTEWILNIQLQLRSENAVSITEKVSKFQ